MTLCWWVSRISIASISWNCFDWKYFNYSIFCIFDSFTIFFLTNFIMCKMFWLFFFLPMRPPWSVFFWLSIIGDPSIGEFKKLILTFYFEEIDILVGFISWNAFSIDRFLLDMKRPFDLLFLLSLWIFLGDMDLWCLSSELIFDFFSIIGRAFFLLALWFLTVILFRGLRISISF